MVPHADTKCPPAAQRKQAKRACNYVNENYIVTILELSMTIRRKFYFHSGIIPNKHASLACAARLADTVCPQSHPADAWTHSI